MTKDILEAALQVGVLIPFSILFMKERTRDNYLRILFFALIYIGYQIVLVLPKLVKTLNFIDSNWNWEGKTYGIIFGVICYFVFRKFFSENDFFTLRQNNENFKKTLIASIFIVVLAVMIAPLFGSSPFDSETLAFQLTMPGIDEEMMFRGILLGLLLTALKDKISFLGNPAVLLTAVLFGFLHALTLGKDYSISFEPIYFLQTGFGGYVWAWVAMKSRSILLPILSHVFANFFAALVTMFR